MEEQTLGVSCAEWKGFRSMAKAMEYLDEGIREGLRTGAEQTMEVYTDGSFYRHPKRKEHCTTRGTALYARAKRRQKAIWARNYIQTILEN